MPAKSVTFIVTLVIVYSYNLFGNDCEKNDNPVYSTLNVDTSRKEIRNPIRIKTLNCDNWEIFWTTFTTATRKKDTAAIIKLTNFPFLQNIYLADKSDFMELWVSQTFDLRKSDTPVHSSELTLGLGPDERAALPKFDSVRYTYKYHKNFYFAKVKGCYKLIKILTPG